MPYDRAGFWLVSRLLAAVSLVVLMICASVFVREYVSQWRTGSSDGARAQASGVGMPPAGGVSAPLAAVATATQRAVLPSATVAVAVETATPTATPLPPTATATATLTWTPLPAPTIDPPTATPVVPSRIVRIAAAKIGLDAPVVPVGWKVVERDGKMESVWDVASHAAGHHKNSSFPGRGGNIVIAAHSDIEGGIFGRLPELQHGDQVTLRTEDGQSFVYQIDERVIVDETNGTPEQYAANARYIGPTEDERLTMITCYPPGQNTHRLIVIARPH